MQMTSKRKGRDLTVSLSGELDHHEAASVRAQMDKLLEDPSVINLTLDLAGLTFMDSSGIGVLLGRYKAISARGGQMSLTHVKPRVERILRMAGIYSILRRG